MISDAIAMHLTGPDIVVQHDGGLRFGPAITVFAGSLFILVIRRCQIPILGYFFARHRIMLMH